MSATQTKSSHAYGIGILVVIVALGVSITWYTSYWLPEENQNPSTTPDAPEIKANNADLDMKKDTDIGMSDLKKP